MPTDVELADLCLDLYSGSPTLCQQVLCGPNTDSTCVGVRETDNAVSFVFRGSKTPLDWFRNFEALMINTEIGQVEQGFYTGLHETEIALSKWFTLGAPIYITGHSRGAAEALLFGAILRKQGIEVAGITTFACPRPGGTGVRALLADTPTKSYINQHDLVCDVPIPECPLFPYMDAFNVRRDFSIATLPGLPEWGILRRHHMQLYRAATELKR